VTAWPERRRAAPVQALLGRLSSYVLRPPEAAHGAAPRSSLFDEAPRLSLVGDEPLGPVEVAPADVEPLRPVVVVLGLAPRAGTSTLARALGGRLAGIEPGGAAILVTAGPPRGGIAGAAAARLARLLADDGWAGHGAIGSRDAPRAVGRLVVLPGDEPLARLAARRDAPLVVDVGHGDSPAAAVAVADHAVLVCPPDVEPALVIAVEGSLRAAGRGVSLVVARALDGPPPELGHALTVPESRLAAQLTLGCREPRGALAPVAAELVERCLAEVIT
jgi:hypothetical protein